ncbi:hypothetical protein SDC9_11699 [bioreactor metagenome]|uniref:Phage major capsid protein, HK97 family n=2 Tax=root TaxID=1 RepID=A0A652ZTA4_9SPIR|nr:Phage major capsid protein, HK97 family [uncultured Spirochaetota bacterium]
MDPEVKKALEDLGKSWKDYRETNDARMEAIEKGLGHAELDAKLANIEASITEAKAQINRINLGGAGQASHQGPSAIANELVGWMRNKDRQTQFVSKVSASVNADGGFIVIPEIDTEIARVASATCAMRGLANVKTIGRPSFVKFVNKGGLTASGDDEGDEKTGNEGTPGLARIEIFAHNLRTRPVATEESLEDLDFDVGGWLAEEAGIAFAEKEDDWFIDGDGKKKARGFLSHTIVANASYEWGKIGYIASGAAADFASSNPSDKIIDLIHSLKAKYRRNGVFLTNNLTLAKIRKFKDGQGNYLWQPSFVAGQPDMLAGYPVSEDDYMPDVGANAYPLAFADWKQGYQIVDRRGIKILVDPYTTEGAVKFRTYKRVGGDVINFEAIKLLKIASS